MAPSATSKSWGKGAPVSQIYAGMGRVSIFCYLGQESGKDNLSSGSSGQFLITKLQSVKRNNMYEPSSIFSAVFSRFFNASIKRTCRIE